MECVKEPPPVPNSSPQVNVFRICFDDEYLLKKKSTTVKSRLPDEDYNWNERVMEAIVSSVEQLNMMIKQSDWMCLFPSLRENYSMTTRLISLDEHEDLVLLQFENYIMAYMEKKSMTPELLETRLTILHNMCSNEWDESVWTLNRDYKLLAVASELDTSSSKGK